MQLYGHIRTCLELELVLPFQHLYIHTAQAVNVIELPDMSDCVNTMMIRSEGGTGDVPGEPPSPVYHLSTAS